MLFNPKYDMKAIFILNSLANVGGVERMLVDKANYLATNGWDIVFLTYEQGQHPIVYNLHSSIEHYDLDCRYFALYRYAIAKRFFKYLRLKKRFRHRLQDVISKHHTQLLITTTYCSEFLYDISAVCGDKVKTVIESHTAYAHDMVPHSMKERFVLHHKLRAIRHYHLLVSLTESDAKSWRQQGINVIVIPDHVACYPEMMPQIKREEGRIIAVGRLHKQKRFDRLIDAFSLIASKYPQWHIDVYGRGTEKDELLKQIALKQLENRIFIHEPIDDIFSEYQRSQFFVLSSDYEGFGLVIVEAMACGTPVISTDCPFGPGEIIEDGVTGLLYEMDVNYLASKIEWMISHEKERHEMGIKAYQAVARFKKENVIKEWEKAYVSLIE